MQFVPFLPRTLCGQVSVRLRLSSFKKSWSLILRSWRMGRFSGNGSVMSVVPKRERWSLVYLNQRLQKDIRYLVRMEPGIQSCDADVGIGPGFVPRFGLVARANSSAPGSRCQIRLGLPRSSFDPMRSLWKAPRVPHKILPIYMPGPKSMSLEPVGLDWIRRLV